MVPVCEADGQVWGASGTVTNPTEQDLVYVLNIGVIVTEGRSSVLRRNVVLEVPAGQSVDFEEPELVTADPEGLECVVRANRGTALTE